MRAPGQLTSVEQQLLDCAVAGATLDLTAGDDRRIRADVVRAVLTDDLAPPGRIDPRGLQLSGAVIEGRLDLRLVGSRIALDFRQCTFSGDLDFRDAELRTLRITAGRFRPLSGDGGPTPVILLEGSSFTGDVEIGFERVCSANGPAVAADRMTVGGALQLEGTFAGLGPEGAVRLLNAHVGGQLNLSRSEIVNRTGPGVAADGLVADADLWTGVIVGAHDRGALRMPGARVKGQLDLRDGAITNDSGPAVDADGLVVHGNAWTGTLTGVGVLGALRLGGAQVRGHLDLRDGPITNDSGPAVSAERLTVDGYTFIGAVASGRGEPITMVSLEDARLGWLGVALETFSGGRRLAISGLTYEGLPNDGADDVQVWVDVLGCTATDYAAQPYQHLAAAYQAAGHLGDQRAVLTAQQDHRRRWLRQVRIEQPSRFAKLRLTSRLAGLRLYRAVAGYGYRPWKAAWWLLGIVALANVLVFAAAHTSPSHASKPAVVAYRTDDKVRHRCSEAEQVGLALRVSIPLLGNVTEGSCQLDTTTATGGYFTVATWVLEFSAWATATLVVAGYTSVIRKS